MFWGKGAAVGIYIGRKFRLFLLLFQIIQDTDHQACSKAKLMAAEESWLYHVRSQDYCSESVQLPGEGATVLTERSVIVLGRDQGERKAETAVKRE